MRVSIVAAGRKPAEQRSERSVAELFVTLWEDHQAAHAAAAVAQARQSGITEAVRLFEAGGRAFLAGSWQRRDLALLFTSGDAPPGFASRRQLGRRA